MKVSAFEKAKGFLSACVMALVNSLYSIWSWTKQASYDLDIYWWQVLLKFNNSYGLQVWNELLYQAKLPFPLSLSYFHYHPVMVSKYIHETWRYCFIVSVRANLDFCNLLSQLWPAPSTYVWRRRPNPLLVNEGGSGPWQSYHLLRQWRSLLTVIFMLERAVRSWWMTFVLQLHLRLIIHLEAAVPLTVNSNIYSMRWNIFPVFVEP